MAIMLWIFLLQLVNSFVSLYGIEHLCTSNACFTLHMEPVSFEEAHRNCVHNGGYLMTIRDKEEEDVLRSLFSQIQRQRQDRALKFWIGLKLDKGNCVVAGKTLRGFKWISGEDFHYSNWEKEPVRTCTEQRCVKVHYTPSAQNQVKWAASSCKSPTYYVCKFYFKGMCKPLALLGPGQITYTAHFLEKPLKSEMQSYPPATYADISCGDQQSHYSMCGVMDYRWTVPGPFCKTGKQNCTINNGGCEHLCHQDADEVRCICKAGYDLDDNGLTCTITDLCNAHTCEYRCVSRGSGYSCQCPEGFKLDVNQHTCSDVDECPSQTCDHVCVNTHGSYMCACHGGYKMVDGQCSDMDECKQTICEHECINTAGSFLCTCPEGFHIEADGSTCTPDVTETPAVLSDDTTEEKMQENFTESLTRNTVELQHQSPHTDAPLPHQENVTNGEQLTNTSLVAGFANTVNSRVIVCVLGSVIPLLLLVAVTLAIALFRCSRSKKEAKKITTTDGYCWVSSGLDPRLEKLYESILTDDL